jgi:ABC-2 type transport system permease protein
VVQDIVDGFASELNTRTAMAQLGISQADQEAGTAAVGGIERVSGGRSLSPFAYYTFGMAVMFMLYVVGNIAGRAHLELSNNTFDRIVITNARPIQYLVSKMGAASAAVFLQFVFLVVAATLLFGIAAGKPLGFWLWVAVVAAGMALAVGALTALVTSLNFRLGNKAVSEAFSSVAVFVMAMLGGSFLPLEQSAPALAAVGRWFPNGAGLDALLNLSIGAPFSAWGVNLMRLVIMAVVLLVAAVLAFPKRRVF